jgi:DNA helicase-2/ATP-dependent DNA helicase PcrA
MSTLQENLKKLNPQQLNAVMHRGSPMIIKALAGSGKTSTVTCRYVKLVIQDQVPISQILMVTFTRKAAEEMKRRTADILATEGYMEKDENGDPPKQFIGTFHAIAAQLLRDYSTNIGLSPNFTILDEDETKYLLKKIFKEVGIPKKQKDLPEDNPLRSWDEFAAIHSKIVNRCQDPLVLMPQTATQQEDQKKLEEIIQRFRTHKKELNVVDYDDLLLAWDDLLDLPNIGDEIRTKWKHIMVDEYQDTNLLQESILSKLDTTELCVVGDQNQSIYLFREANVRNFTEFPNRYPNAAVFPLEINYRSTPSILDAANMILDETNENIRLKAARENGDDVTRVQLPDQFAESEFVVKEIRRALERKIDPREICVLCRTSNGTNDIERKLAEYGIFFEKRGGTKISDRLEIRDCLAMARLLLNPKDEPALLWCLKNYPGIGEVTALKIANEWRKLINTWEKEKNTTMKMDPNIGQFLMRFMKKTMENNEPNPFTIFALTADFHSQEKPRLHSYLDSILAEWKKLALLNYTNNNFEERTHNVETEITAWKNETNLTNLLERMALSKSEEEERFQAEAAKGKKRIIVSTIHSAKGLEWDFVVLVGAGSKQMPHKRCQTEEEINEERRLAYVALTRARDQLTVTYPKRVNIYGEYHDQTASHLVGGNFRKIHH